jgi:hypothetical protein
LAKDNLQVVRRQIRTVAKPESAPARQRRRQSPWLFAGRELGIMTIDLSLFNNQSATDLVAPSFVAR